MKRKEIGSEFYFENSSFMRKCSGVSDHRVYLLSGRTALDYIIRDIKAERGGFGSIYAPSYCCKSMLDPFIQNGVNIYFYKVSCGPNGFQFDYDYNNHCDAVLLIDYFGYESLLVASVAKLEKEACKIIIYDSTHKINGNDHVMQNAMYSFCSFRKWFFSNIADVWKSGKFIADKPAGRNYKYETIRNKAAWLKRDYMNGVIDDKRIYLSLFSKAEKLLDHDYFGYTVGLEEIERLVHMDIEKMVKKRIENARRLTKGLKTFNYDWLIAPIREVKESDSPLFVPILIERDLRDIVRNRFIDQNIYCPVHWPLSELHNIDDSWKDIYYSELSLICDQRYSLSDMDNILEKLNKIGHTI